MLDEMTTRPDPPPCSDRELALRAIAATYRRARDVQRNLQTRLSPTPRPATVDAPPPATMVLDPDLQAAADAAGLGPTRALDGDDGAELPNPLITDGLLSHFLEQATTNQGAPARDLRGAARRMVELARGDQQAAFNTSIVHALHQFDHRTRLHARIIGELETETAALRRAVTMLESQILAERQRTAASRSHQPS